MLPSHIEAENRYHQLRTLALQLAQDDSKSQHQAPLKFKLIDSLALQEAAHWELSPRRLVDWDWFAGYHDFKRRYPKRFEVALWQAESLVGLSMGRPTYNGHSLRLDFIEARPKDLGPRPLVVSETLVAYGVYARLLNASQIRIMHPINPEVRAYYEQFGYHYRQEGDFLYKEVV
ncbi:hypothetical protein [Marinimicrobium locisalis]|uniref:hypothetical protein n=1 Tax=Marinimicrobium locisalis TaxID=546022 RepID=UPI0032217F87